MRPETFEETVRLYDRMIKSQMRKLRIYRNFDEFYQCGLVGLWRAYEQFEEGKGAFSTYAFYTVRGYLLTKLRGDKEQEERFTSLEPQLAELIPAAGGEEEEFFSYLQRASLNERQYVILTERFYYGKKLTSIAREQGMSYEQVRSLYRRALVKVKKHLQEGCL